MSELITAYAAAKLAHVTQPTINRWADCGYLQVAQDTPRRYAPDDVMTCAAQRAAKRNKKTITNDATAYPSPWAGIDLIPGESMRPLDCGNTLRFLLDPEKIACDIKLVVSNFGRVYDAVNNVEITAVRGNDGQLYIRVPHRGHDKMIPLDFVIAYAWVDNAKSKYRVYHLDGNSDNCASENLIWMRQAEMEGADSLKNDSSAFDSYIGEIRKDNANPQQWKCITLANGMVFALTPEAYNDWITGRRTLDEIYWFEFEVIA